MLTGEVHKPCSRHTSREGIASQRQNRYSRTAIAWEVGTFLSWELQLQEGIETDRWWDDAGLEYREKEGDTRLHFTCEPNVRCCGQVCEKKLPRVNHATGFGGRTCVGVARLANQWSQFGSSAAVRPFRELHASKNMFSSLTALADVTPPRLDLHPLTPHPYPFVPPFLTLPLPPPPP